MSAASWAYVPSTIDIVLQPEHERIDYGDAGEPRMSIRLGLGFQQADLVVEFLHSFGHPIKGTLGDHVDRQAIIQGDADWTSQRRLEHVVETKLGVRGAEIDQ
jgi:hypothetical protein